MPCYVASREELRKHGKSEWDVVAVWAVELEYVAGGLRNTIAKELDMGTPCGTTDRYNSLKAEPSLRTKKIAFYEEYCKRDCEPIRPDLIDCAKRGDFRNASPREVEVKWWLRLIWFSFAFAAATFGAIVGNDYEQYTLLICAFLISIGACLVGFGLGRLFTKKHIEHESNNMIFKVDAQGTNLRQSDITNFEIFIIIFFGVIILAACFVYVRNYANNPVLILPLSIYSATSTMIPVALCTYRNQIRKMLLELMFKAQTMFSIQKHLDMNPQVLQTEPLPGDDNFVKRCLAEIERQYTAEPTRFKC